MITFRKIPQHLLKLGLLSSIILISGCLDPIELNIPKGFEETFVFQASLTKGEPSTFEMTSSRLFDFTPESARRVSLRSVILEDESGVQYEVEPFGEGIYRETFTEDTDFRIETGKSYKLIVSTFDNRTFETNLEPLLEVPQIDTVMYQVINKEVIVQEENIRFDSVVRFSINTPLLPESSTDPVDLRWKVRRIFQITDTPIDFGVFQKTCYVTEEVDVTEVKTFNGASANTSELVDYDIYDQPFSFHLAEGMVLEVIQQSLSPGAYTYWSQIGQVLDRDGNMFETPAGKVRSNFVNPNDPDDEVFGYFFATKESVARVYVAPETAPGITMYCPPPNFLREDGSCGVLICCDCLSAEVSTIIKPSFWGE